MGRFRLRRLFFFFCVLRRRQRHVVFLPAIPRILLFRVPGERRVRQDRRIGDDGVRVFGAYRTQEPARATVDHSAGLRHRHLNEIAAADSLLPHLVDEGRDLLARLDLRTENTISTKFEKQKKSGPNCHMTLCLYVVTLPLRSDFSKYQNYLNLDGIICSLI